jgi:tetratricopeptide (TPR) repeat protein
MTRETAQASTHPLAYVRRSRGWSYQDIARVIADNARALGVPMAARREKIWRWEHWGVVPERDSQRALARALGVPGEEIDTRPWPQWLPAQDKMPSGLPWTRAGSLSALASLLDHGPRGDHDDPAGRPIAVGPALHEAVADWTAAVARGAALDADADTNSGTDTGAGEPTVRPHPGVIDEQTLSWLESGLLGLRRLDDRLGGAAVQHRVEADLGLALGLLRHGPYARTLETRLLRTAAGLAQLGGWAATDAGRPCTAQRHFLTGLRLADNAQDLPLAASIWAGLSLQAVLAGRPKDGLAAVDAAGSVAAAATRRTRAMLATRRARAHAGLGDEMACRSALDEAAQLLDAAGTDDDPSWLYWFDDAELAAQTGTALLDLGLAHEGRPELERALKLQNRAYLRDRAIYSARAASARFRTGDPDGGHELGQEALRLAQYCGSPRLTAALNALRPAEDG